MEKKTEENEKQRKTHTNNNLGGNSENIPSIQFNDNSHET